MTATPLGPGAEFDRIRAIASALGSRGRGLGDDAAVLPDGWCASIDLSVEGVHFRRDWLSLEEIGWRSAAAALSDLAAMGASADFLLAGLTAPATASAAELAAVMRGVGDSAGAVGALVVGGDVTSGPAWSVSVTVLGRAPGPVRRSGARPGDGIWVSGALGGSRAALRAWQEGRVPDAGARVRFARPEPRIAVGRWLGSEGARAMIDLSDGLAGDLGHLAAASGVGVDVRLEDLPIDPAVRETADRAGLPAPVFAALGGEDYELLVVLPADTMLGAAPGGVPLTRIGTVAVAGMRLTLDGRPVSLAGFDHFG